MTRPVVNVSVRPVVSVADTVTVEVKPFSAAFDVVAHELTHAVTGNSARLNSFPYSEAAALDEGFSDIFGVSPGA